MCASSPAFTLTAIRKQACCSCSSPTPSKVSSRRCIETGIVRKLTPAADPMEVCRITLEEAAGMLSPSTGPRSVAVFEHGTLQVKLYAPRGHDAQTPHSRDEVYVVARGNGWFVNEG